MSMMKRLVRKLVPRGIRNWTRAPWKSAGLGWAELQYALGLTRRMEIRPGWLLECHPWAYQHSYAAHVKDPEQVAELDGFIDSCTPHMVLFDLGAHFGLFSLASLHYGGPAARAIAVDASPTACRYIAIQKNLNMLGDRLDVVRACVCDATGARDMVAVGILSDGYFIRADEDHPSSETTSVPAITLVQLADQFKVRPTHVKIDVEGFEGLVLNGGACLLRADTAPVLFLELHNQLLREWGQDPAQILDRLAEFNYELFHPNGAPLVRETILEKPLIRLIGRKGRTHG